MCVWSIFNNFTMNSFLPHTDFTQFPGSTDTPSVVIVYVVWDLCLSAHFHPEKNTNQVLLEKMRKAPCVGEHTQTRGNRWRRMIGSGLMERFVGEPKITHFYHNMPALHRFHIHINYISKFFLRQNDNKPRIDKWRHYVCNLVQPWSWNKRLRGHPSLEHKL